METTRIAKMPVETRPNHDAPKLFIGELETTSLAVFTTLLCQQMTPTCNSDRDQEHQGNSWERYNSPVAGVKPKNTVRLCERFTETHKVHSCMC